MLDEAGYLIWCQSLGLGPEAKELIDQIRSSPPARRVGGGRKNVVGRYPSRKMGVTIQFESHTNEFSAILEYEHDPDCLEFYDQPCPSIPLEYRSKQGKRMHVLHTADFFVLRTRSAGWVECKTEQDLTGLGERNPERFQKGPNGGWRCPPGESYASQFGLDYQIRSSQETNSIYRRNLEFLEDYLRFGPPIASAEVSHAIRSIVEADPGITLAQLIQVNSTFTADDVYGLIAAGSLHADLRSVPLAEPTRVSLFCQTDAGRMQDHTLPFEVEKFPVVFSAAGQSVVCDGGQRQITETGAGEMAPVGQTSASLSAKVPTQLLSASPMHLQAAYLRYTIIRPYLEGERLQGNKVPARTIYDWIKKFRTAENLHGNGFWGLLPRTNASGNRTKKLPELTRALMNDFIENEYETVRQKRATHVYGSLIRMCEARGTRAPSYKTFVREIARRPKHEQVLKRKGHRAAYQYEPSYLDLEITTPRHGDRPFHICHIDHTQLDIELVCSRTKQNLGRPWCTIMTDAFSRRLLAVFLCYDPPSYRSCMMVLRECVHRHGRFPQILVVDGGKEFESIYFDTLLARFECTKKTRPPAKARFGSVCERLFHTSNTQFIHNLAGNTQITKAVRQVTKSVDPKEHAAWTLGELYKYLCEWAYEVYDTISHPALGQSPRAAFDAIMAQSGSRPQRTVAYDEEFWLWTLPTTARGTALIVPGKGVKIHHIFYWSNAFRDPGVERNQVPIRYDPYDAGIAHAYVHKHWVQCVSEHYRVFRGRSERELIIATAELRKQAQVHAGQFNLTTKKLADFLESAEGYRLLNRQRSSDQELKDVLASIQADQSKDEDSCNRIDHSVNSPTRVTGEAGLPSSVELRVYEEY